MQLADGDGCALVEGLAVGWVVVGAVAVSVGWAADAVAEAEALGLALADRLGFAGALLLAVPAEGSGRAVETVGAGGSAGALLGADAVGVSLPWAVVTASTPAPPSTSPAAVKTATRRPDRARRRVDRAGTAGSGAVAAGAGGAGGAEGNSGAGAAYAGAAGAS
ncbi:hypothetical protein GCM10010441_19190 [Kitasatospora paracochleata]|uniref:Uncharacterized protein n=1 Tax=Kitasatospora paracochleata TaxID=58354 RepID=A0ABT1J3D5_9ACTN|nr:hypothetical protein [Kitasatospora paracochleata]MCP2311945.1 hypothetical protein [Kitasatospora paracochleata]